MNFDSLDISVSIVTTVRTCQPRNYGSIPNRSKRFFVAPNVKTAYGGHAVSYSLCKGELSRRQIEISALRLATLI